MSARIESTPGVMGGKPRVAGRRITVQDIATWCVRLGRSVDEVATEYDLTLADVHAALAYYFDHRSEIDRTIAEGRLFAEGLKARTPSKVTEKLLEQPLRGAGG
jgi:uncharacterized protein (DUF433 family)